MHVFFIGMLHGYTQTNIKPLRIECLNGSKFNSYVVEELGIAFTDLWQTTPLTRKSFGTTTLTCPEGIVWMMQYWGEYPDEVIPFLRKALLATYSNRQFIGGRGPRYYTDDQYVYLNVVESNDFDKFNGTEYILDKQGNILGWHKYHGMKTW